MDANPNLLSNELYVDSTAAAHLKETAMWSKFLAVTGMVISIIIALAGLVAGPMLANMNRNFGDANSGLGAMGSLFITVFYIFIGVVYFFLSLFLFRFATRMKQALLTTDQENFNASLMNLKLVYRTLGIITVVYLSLLALVLLVGIGSAVFMR
jgi:Family of unknown function (DUF5362)